MTYKWKVLGAGLCLTLLVAALLWWRLGEPHYARMLFESPAAGRCKHQLTRPMLERSLSLTKDFLLRHQKPEGNFDYEYDFAAKTNSSDDNEVRQAGALWGMTLAYAYRPEAALQAAVERGLAFFDERSRKTRSGRCVAYPGASLGSTGTVALLSLAYIDYLRAQPPTADAETVARHRSRLAEYLKFLEKTLRPDGLWHGKYDLKKCAGQGEPSPYADGEALLALVKAAKYLGFTELVPTVLRAAKAGRAFNIDAALAEHPDSNTTKGYYQWSSMAFYELATSDFPDTHGYGDTVLQLADWMIDTHDVLWRLKNTGYAFEGIVHAHVLAKARKDRARVDKYGCVIDVGLSRLLAWQVGGPLGSDSANRGQADPLALGGVQNDARDAALRIDVAQHQAHALLLALRYVYTAN